MCIKRECLDRFITLGYFDKGIKGHIIGRGSVNYSEIIALRGNEIIKEEWFKSFISKAYKRNVKLIDLYTDVRLYEVYFVKRIL